MEALPSFLRFLAKGASIGVPERLAMWEGEEHVSGGPLDCEYTCRPSTGLGTRLYVYRVGPAVLSERHRGNSKDTAYLTESHTSNRLAYSRSDASSQSRGAGTASSVKGAVARQSCELSLLKGAVHSDCLYWHGDRRATPLVSNKMAVWVRDSPACEIMKSRGIANLVLEQELL